MAKNVGPKPMLRWPMEPLQRRTVSSRSSTTTRPSTSAQTTWSSQENYGKLLVIERVLNLSCDQIKTKFALIYIILRSKTQLLLLI